jgi:16S rRNA (cytosine1402-N4)-methyltransferase
MLAPGGRFAVITFHSLEDRLVKASFKQLVDSAGPTAAALEAEAATLSGGKLRRDRGSPGVSAGGAMRSGPAIFVYAEGRPFWRPSAEEIAANPRSRSATLRVLERVR